MQSPKEGLVITGEVLLVVEKNNVENAHLFSSALFYLVVCQYLLSIFVIYIFFFFKYEHHVCEVPKRDW